MLTEEENRTLIETGPGTPMGDLMRRYWQPVAAKAELAQRWTMRVRILGENLVLYRDKQGKYGLIGEFCPHRGASLAYGIPQQTGIRCPYHGWQFDGDGTCIDQPNETRHALLGKKTIVGYPVQEMGGLLFAYLGPAPAPLLPKLDGLVAEGVIRHVGRAIIPCNWLQIMENSVDPVHVEWAHGALLEFLHEDEGLKTPWSRKHAKIGFDEFAYGIIKRRMLVGQTEEHSDWKVGHPLVFPNTLAVGVGGGDWQEYRFQFRVPVDDTNTLHFWYSAYTVPAGAQVPEHLLRDTPVYDVPFLDERGEYMLDLVHAQDIMNWVTQGPIADRTKESLGASDRGLVVYRRMLMREMEKVRSGLDPILTFRNPGDYPVINLPLEIKGNMASRGFEANFRQHMTSFSPIADEIVAVFAGAEKKQPANAN